MKITNEIYCQFCHNVARTLGYHPDFNDLKILYCKECSYGFTDIDYINGEEFLHDYYKKRYREIRNAEDINKYLQSQKTRDDEQIIFIGKKEISSVFEIGCAAGSLLNRFVAEKYGSEYDASYCEYAKRHGVKIVQSIEDLPQQVDLVISSHSLEHLCDPCKFLRLAFNKLKMGGYLFIEVPNDSEYTVTRTIKNMSHTGHLHFFSKNSLKRVVGDFKILKLETAGSRQVVPYGGGIIKKVCSLFAEGSVIRCLLQKW